MKLLKNIKLFISFFILIVIVYQIFKIILNNLERIKIHKLIKMMPKAELHVHIGGTIEPETIFKLAKKNNIKIPYNNIEELKKTYNFKNFEEFEKAINVGHTVLIDEDDYYYMTFEYLKKASSENIVHAEMFFSPQSHVLRGIPIKSIIMGIHNACVDAKKQFQISASPILCFSRTLSEEDAFQCLNYSLPYIKYFNAVGLAGYEVGNPPKKFKNVFAACKELGLHLVAHTGEMGTSADYVWQAIKDLHVDRIDHGISTIKDDKLMEYLKNTQLPLTVCPLSNLKMKYISSMYENPVKKMLKKGLCVTVNSDDPAIFGGYLNENLIQTFDYLNLDYTDLYKLAYNSFIASFISEEDKKKYIEQLNICFDNYKKGLM